ncbi:hypothetical protein TMatcc_011223 [Talaromyces marneffei ATCC 18224]|uniref:uncharacterized protein n=1 Tax=Talaromyces marneffei TaxID=37727 RepID=UPI0012A8ECC3|nr:uncharacterized protein EYB26_010032 [Talaromyces marneffei]QGA22316.1 hypothetical protein EYB26_010032 [Talaromyces marneffei]
MRNTHRRTILCTPPEVAVGKVGEGITVIMGNLIARSQTGEIPAEHLVFGATVVPVTGAGKPIVGKPLHPVSLDLSQERHINGHWHGHALRQGAQLASDQPYRAWSMRRRPWTRKRCDGTSR